MVFQSTATAQQLQGYGFPASALSSVRLYHFLPDTVSWAEVPSTQQSGDAGMTVTGDLSEAGDYALGILNTGVTPTGACVVNMTPLSGQMCSGPTVHVEAIFNSPAGMNPTSAALQADGSEVPGATATLSGAGLYLDMAGDVTLAPGPHRAKVWASDLAGLPGFGTALFYVQRENTFPDVPPDFWAWRQVEATKLSGIVAGYPDGTYQPGTAVTRDQMAVYIARALAGGDAYVPSGPATADFADVPTTYWAYEYIEYAKSMNVVVGYPDGTYQPDTVVTRDQMAVYVSRAVVNPTGDAGLQGYTPPATPSFPDVLTSNWAYEYIEYAKAQGIVAGYPDGTYQPGVTVTRDQMAVYVARAFQLAM
jgi:hypothetical protein